MKKQLAHGGSRGLKAFLVASTLALAIFAVVREPETDRADPAGAKETARPAPTTIAPPAPMRAAEAPLVREECSSAAEDVDEVVDTLVWAGPEDEPKEAPSPPELPAPMGVAYAQVAERLGDHFPHMHDPPPSKAHEREYHQYAADMMAQLHLSGERRNLELARMTLFDRIGAPASRLKTQSDMVARFLDSTVGDEARAAEVIRYLEEPAEEPQPNMKERAFDLGDKELTVSVSNVYGTVVLLVRGRG
jgi:hypothetical protein